MRFDENERCADHDEHHETRLYEDCAGGRRGVLEEKPQLDLHPPYAGFRGVIEASDVLLPPCELIVVVAQLHLCHVGVALRAGHKPPPYSRAVGCLSHQATLPTGTSA